MVYTYDKSGNRSSLIASGTDAYTTDYSYDLNNRLVAASKDDGSAIETTSYYYDWNGNQHGKTTSLLSSGSVSMGYSLTESLAGAELSSYNGFNQLVESTVDDAAVTYTYYPDGSRATKNGTEFILDGGNVVLEIEGGAVTAKYTRAMNLVSSTIGGATSYYLYNAHGDVLQLADSAGVVTKNYDYEAFGYHWIYFDGMIMGADKFGNLNLGYVGAMMGFSGVWLLNPATSGAGDGFWVQYGIDMVNGGR